MTKGYKHDGRSSHPLYRTHKDMIDRCHNTDHADYEAYGQRGVLVCDEWREDFWRFVSDMPARPSRRHSIDRIHNDRGYEPGNVKWSTPLEQSRNRRSSRIIEHDGLSMTLSEWAEKTGVPMKLIHLRLSRGWPFVRAIDLKRVPAHVSGKAGTASRMAARSATSASL
jgi:hypothetical protein